MKTFNTLFLSLSAALGLLACVAATSSVARAATVEEDIASLQHEWARAFYKVDEDDKSAVFESLIARSQRMVDAYPGRPEPIVWHAIVLSSAAKFGGGLGALSKAKQARKELERAAKIDPNTLNGSIYASLGSLYANVPGWPIGFGDEDKAEEMFKKALAINPDSIDANFFYGQLMAEEGEPEKARALFEKALAAPPRPGREDADAGRLEEIRKALAELDE